MRSCSCVFSFGQLAEYYRDLFWYRVNRHRHYMRMRLRLLITCLLSDTKLLYKLLLNSLYFAMPIVDFRTFFFQHITNQMTNELNRDVKLQLISNTYLEKREKRNLVICFVLVWMKRAKIGHSYCRGSLCVWQCDIGFHWIRISRTTLLCKWASNCTYFLNNFGGFSISHLEMRKSRWGSSLNGWPYR